MLPDGSVLEGVMLPRYDEKRHLTSVLHAKVLTLANSDEIHGDGVRIEFFNPDRSSRARIDLAQATLNQQSGTLTAKQAVEIQADRLTAAGTGIFYNMESSEAFLLGPATTRIKAPPPETAMITTPRATTALAAAVVAVSLPALAAPPPRMTPDDYAALAADSASRADAIHAANTATAESLATTTKESTAAREKTIGFLQQNGLTLIANELEKPADPPAAPPQPEFKPGPEDTVIRCEDGMYFDSQEGLLVYLKDIVVTDPRFTIHSSGDLKVFFEKKPVKAAPETPAEGEEDKPKDDLNLGISTASLGDVERIVATGIVKIEQKAVGDKLPIKASAAILSYNVKTKEIILSGGYPWVQQGPNAFRATKPNQTLRIFTTGTFATDGGQWDTNLRLQQDR